MSKNTRWALAVVGVAIIIVAAIVVGTGGDHTDATHSDHENTPAATTETGATAGGASGASGRSGQGSTGGSGSGGATAGAGNGSGGASPQNESGGAGAAGAVVSPIFEPGVIRTVKAEKGDVVVIRARAKQAGELHVHGYDKHIELVPGKTVRLTMRATFDGEFPIEFHFADAQQEAGTLRVNP